MNVSKYNAVLPANIEKEIERQGLKNSAVAKKAGYSAQQFSCMLNGRKIIKPCDILAISEALGVSVNDLFGTKQKKPRKPAQAAQTSSSA